MLKENNVFQSSISLLINCFALQELAKILDNAKHGFIYFSMGSNLKSKDIPQNLKEGFLKIFSKLNQIIIWKFEEVLPNLPKNVHILKWAPQQSILGKLLNCEKLLYNKIVINYIVLERKINKSKFLMFFLHATETIRLKKIVD